MDRFALRHTGSVKSTDPGGRRSRAPGGVRRRLAAVWTGLEPYVQDRAGLGLLTGASLLSGFAEAFLLFLVVRAAVGIAAEEDRIELSLGTVSAEITVVGLLVIALLSLVLMLALGLLVARTTARLASAALGRARRRTITAYVRSGWRTQAGEHEGRLQELLTSHVTRISNGVVTLGTGLTAALNFAALMATALFVNTLAAGVIVVGVVILFFCLRPLTRRTKRHARAQTKANAGFASMVAQTVRLSAEIRVFGVGEPALQHVDRASTHVEQLVYRARFLQRATPAVYQNVAMLLVILGMIAVYVADLGDVADLGAVVLLMVRALSYSQQVQSALQTAGEIAPFIDDLRTQTAAYEADAVIDRGEPISTVDSLRMIGGSFAYHPGTPVLTGIGFTVTRGEVVGIVGPSGSGKSTLVQLLLRLRELDEGTYEVNGLPAERFSLAAWADVCTYVPQDNKLLAGSVTENVRFFRDVPSSAIEHACHLAHLHDDILQLPEAYETLIGPGGADLSGGQRQRLGLARALLTDPSVLVLDEPTSALDVRSEALVQQTFGRLKGSMTMFIVAHRMTTLTMCDRIMVLRGGRLEAFGTPDELRDNDFFDEAVRLSTLS